MQTLFGVQELAKRWSLAPASIRKMEQDGKLHRLPDLPGVKYSAKEVYQLESIGPEAQALSAWERRQLESQINDLRKENDLLRVRLSSVVLAAQGLSVKEA